MLAAETVELKLLSQAKSCMPHVGENQDVLRNLCFEDAEHEV
jgi:hypothetical protein